MVHEERPPERKELGWVFLILLPLIPVVILAGFFYGMLVIETGSWTPVIHEFRSPPPGYQSVAAFAAGRRHDFPTLFGDPEPSPVAGTGHLANVYDRSRGGPDGVRVDVKTLRLRRTFGADLNAQLEVPINPALLAHLRSLSKGAIVTVSGIGHGDGKYDIDIHPVHRVNGYEP